MTIKRRVTGDVKKVRRIEIDDINPPQVERVRKGIKFSKLSNIKKGSIVDLLCRSFQLCAKHKIPIPQDHVDYAARVAAHKIHHTIKYLRRRGDISRRSIYVLTDIYLIASVLYYHTDRSIMPDTLFDSLCKYLHDRYDDIPGNYIVLHNVSKEALEAGSGYDVTVGVFHSMVAEYVYDFYVEDNDESVGEGSKRKPNISKIRKAARKESQRFDRETSDYKQIVNKEGKRYEVFTSRESTKKRTKLRPLRKL